MRETTVVPVVFGLTRQISTHVPRAGDDEKGDSEFLPVLIFQPTSPVRETTSSNQPPGPGPRYFNPRPPCGRRLVRAGASLTQKTISTHVPRAGDDDAVLPSFDRPDLFQPTSPVRETTAMTAAPHTGQAISTHVPRAGDDHIGLRGLVKNPVISTHVPRAGDDLRFA